MNKKKELNVDISQLACVFLVQKLPHAYSLVHERVSAFTLPWCFHTVFPSTIQAVGIYPNTESSDLLLSTQEVL